MQSARHLSCIQHELRTIRLEFGQKADSHSEAWKQMRKPVVSEGFAVDTTLWVLNLEQIAAVRLLP